MISKLVLSIAWLAAAVAAVATVAWIGIVADGNYCWSAFAFSMCFEGTNVGILLRGVIPSCVRYFRTRDRKDLTSLRLAACSFVVLLAEIVALTITAMRGERPCGQLEKTRPSPGC